MVINALLMFDALSVTMFDALSVTMHSVLFFI